MMLGLEEQEEERRGGECEGGLRRQENKNPTLRMWGIRNCGPASEEQSDRMTDILDEEEMRKE